MATKTKAKQDWRELEQEEVIELILEARSDEKSWAEIREMSGGMALGKLMFLRSVGEVEDKDRIKFRSEEDLPAKIQAARDENVSWGLIAARTGLPESKIRSIYEAEYGEGSSKLAGGMSRVAGRNGVVAEKPEPKPKAAKPKAKKAPAKKKAGTKKATAKGKDDGAFGGVKPLKEMDTDELTERLEGKTITVTNSTTGKDSRIVVKTVKASDGEEMEFIEKSGKTRTIAISAIKKASR